MALETGSLNKLIVCTGVEFLEFAQTHLGDRPLVHALAELFYSLTDHDELRLAQYSFSIVPSRALLPDQNGNFLAYGRGRVGAPVGAFRFESRTVRTIRGKGPDTLRQGFLSTSFNDLKTMDHWDPKDNALNIAAGEDIFPGDMTHFGHFGHNVVSPVRPLTSGFVGRLQFLGEVLQKHGALSDEAYRKNNIEHVPPEMVGLAERS